MIKELFIYSVSCGVESTDGIRKLFQVLNTLPYLKSPDCLYFKMCLNNQEALLGMAAWSTDPSVKQPELVNIFLKIKVSGNCHKSIQQTKNTYSRNTQSWEE